MNVTAAVMINPTPKFIHSHSLNAEERESATELSLWRREVGKER
jgi:hypothetical protein